MNSGVEQEIRSDIHGRNVIKHIEEICAFGDRFVGTEGDTRTLNYARAHFERLGVKVEHTPIKVLTFEERSVDLVLTDTNTRLGAVSPFFPKSCRGGVRGQMVYVGVGNEDDYHGVDARGKIVVLCESAAGQDQYWLGPFARRAAIHGAAGLIVIHAFPWPYRMTMESGIHDIGRRFFEEQVPAVSISGLDGLKVMEHIGHDRRNVYLKIDSDLREVESTILSGVIEGVDWPERRTALIAHRDSPIPPAANDNGSGMGCQLEIARVLSKHRPRGTVEFICSTGEESASAGAWCYVQAHKERMRDINALINIDMVGAGGALYMVTGNQWDETEPMAYSAEVMRVVDDVADQLGYVVKRMTGTMTSEEARFAAAGVPVAWFWRWDDYRYHSTHDTPDKIDINGLKAMSDIAAISIWRLANQEPVR